ncbi:hypothetical protein [Metabacillus fastidiosus]|uniref:fibronectin type III domain-containing protein n=1 Tax=Metabacillus fastidiosus TaxID=1458 RepID=UPI003D2BF2C0
MSWKVSGDIQTAYKIDILSNLNDILVYTTGKVTSYSLKHLIPPSALINGNEYKIRITIFNQAGASITSDTEIFQTSSTPVITVDPIGTINTFSYIFTANYEQSENVPLRNYIVYLFDDKKNLLSKSDIKTSSPLEHFFTNLQTEKQYYIEFQATSTKGLTGTSGYIPFDVFYFQPKLNIDLQGKNIDKAGVELSWFVSQILFESNNNPPLFIDNEKIDTRDNSIFVKEGFSISGDFSLKAWIENPISKKTLIKMIGANGHFHLYYDAAIERFVLKKDVNGIIDAWVSDEVTGENFIVVIKQIGCDIDILVSSIQ